MQKDQSITSINPSKIIQHDSSFTRTWEHLFYNSNKKAVLHSLHPFKLMVEKEFAEHIGRKSNAEIVQVTFDTWNKTKTDIILSKHYSVGDTIRLYDKEVRIITGFKYSNCSDEIQVMLFDESIKQSLAYHVCGIKEKVITPRIFLSLVEEQMSKELMLNE